MTENDLLDEMDKELNIEYVRPDEITAPMLQERLGCTHGNALLKLKDKCDAETMKWRWARTKSGHMVKAFSKAGS